NFRRRVEYRKSHGDSIALEFRHPICRDPARGLLQARAVRKQRGRMTIRAHAEKNEIKSWESLIQKSPRLEEIPQVFFVLGRSLGGGGELRRHAADNDVMR